MALGISGQGVVAAAPQGALERAWMEKHNLAKERRSSQKRHLCNSSAGFSCGMDGGSSQWSGLSFSLSHLLSHHFPSGQTESTLGIAWLEG